MTTIYKYSLTNTNSNSSVFGNCEVCNKPCSEVYSQTEARNYQINIGNDIKSGWTHNKCTSLFGHKECLLDRRR